MAECSIIRQFLKYVTYEGGKGAKWAKEKKKQRRAEDTK
jgi:hypothetical protein